MDFYTYKASLETKRGIGSVYDGDTISNLVIDMGFKIKYINSFRTKNKKQNRKNKRLSSKGYVKANNR